MATAPDPAPLKQMQALLECSICTETLTQPRTCHASIRFVNVAWRILLGLRRKQSKWSQSIPEVFECPVCRTTFHVKEEEAVEKMPSNHFINNMLELLTLQQHAKIIKCQSCKAKNPAISRCVSCENYDCKLVETLNQNENRFRSVHCFVLYVRIICVENVYKSTRTGLLLKTMSYYRWNT